MRSANPTTTIGDSLPVSEVGLHSYAFSEFARRIYPRLLAA